MPILEVDEQRARAVLCVQREAGEQDVPGSGEPRPLPIHQPGRGFGGGGGPQPVLLNLGASQTDFQGLTAPHLPPE